MRVFMLLVATCLLVATQAAGDQPVAQENRVTLSLPAGTFKSALEALFKGRVKVYSLAEGLADRPISAVSIKNVPFESALKAICSVVGSTWTFTDNNYLISSRPPEATKKPIPPIVESKPVETEPTVTEPWFGMNRYAVKQILGAPNEIIYYLTPGHEDWHYDDRIISFENCKVQFFSQPQQLQLAVKMGHAPRTLDWGYSQTWDGKASHGLRPDWLSHHDPKRNFLDPFKRMYWPGGP